MFYEVMFGLPTSADRAGTYLQGAGGVIPINETFCIGLLPPTEFLTLKII